MEPNSEFVDLLLGLTKPQNFDLFKKDRHIQTGIHEVLANHEAGRALLTTFLKLHFLINRFGATYGMFKQARAMADLGGDIAIYCIVYKQIQTLLADYTLIRDRLIECLDDLFFTLEEIFTDRVALKESQNDPWMQRGFLETQQKHSQVLEAIRRCDKAVAKIDHQMNLIPPEERVTSLQKVIVCFLDTGISFGANYPAEF